MGRPRPPSPDASFRKHSSRGFRVERVDDDEFEPQAAMRRVKWQDPIAVDLEEVEGEPKPPNPSKSILVTVSADLILCEYGRCGVLMK